ncbi:MAG TPA: 3'(2'),5'-bisphosphate nucleotidase CysQ [Micrococcaceae bacterium]|jgi:3'(2'), 5'-bisphosphate nucleotidase
MALDDDVTATGTDHALAVRLAREAGALLLRLQGDALAEGLPGEQLKALGDLRSQEFLGDQLRRLRPGDAILSEEAADDDDRAGARRVWIIDPLDGTREFSEGRNDWAVHVALWCDGALLLGAVALPGLGITLDSGSNPGPVPATGRQLRLAVSRSRPSALVGWLAEELGAALVPMGSAGYKVGAVVRGEVDAYVHSGGQYEWDSAAPAIVAARHGLHVSRIDGSGLVYNQPDPYLPDLLVCRQELAPRLLGAIESFAGTPAPGTAARTGEGMVSR